MANTLNIPEITMGALVSSTNAINLRSARPSALGTGGPLVVRVTNHVDDDNTEVGADTDKMAIFHSRQYGHPWVKDTGLQHIVADGVANQSATVVYPDYDYSTFE